MVSILILGYGWTGEFLSELLDSEEPHLKYTATTRDGRHNTITWDLGDNASAVNVDALPIAKTVVVTFPVKEAQLMETLMDSYNNKVKDANQPAAHWIILSSTRPFSADTNNRHSPLDHVKDTGRIPSEQVALARQSTILHLAGLWGAQRQPKNWVARFSNKEALKNKLLARQLHLIHGKDVARAILAIHLKQQQEQTGGERWIVTDGGCYDWLVLFSKWASPEQLEMVQHLMDHDLDVQKKWGTNQTLDSLVELGGVKPRLDSNEFWHVFDLKPKEFLIVE
ncbi:hypothetical protein BC941DRAFT_514685 [Chlamydoabsidia padenii]|nr:hypothetical protein BC941DRAFT_514685 [Chlamydoabsidia padenii]